MKCNQIMEWLEELAPSDYSYSWDNPGLIVGRRNQEVNKIMIALDATKEAVEQAVQNEVDLLITHHPMVFSAIKKINDSDFLGEKILTLAEHKIACFAMHTNYDIAGPMAKLCAKGWNLANAKPLEETGVRDDLSVGIGIVGELPKEMSVAQCAKKVKETFGLKEVLCYGRSNTMVKRVAISPGSGRSMLTEAKKEGADLLITGDIGHHEGLDAMDMGFCVIDAGHYGLEQVFIEQVAEYLKTKDVSLDIVTYHEGVPYQVL